MNVLRFISCGPFWEYVNNNKTCSVISYSIVNSLKWLLQLKGDSLSIMSRVLTFFYWLEWRSVDLGIEYIFPTIVVWII